MPNRYPLPLISELIHRISGKKWFTKFDVRWGYNNVRIKDGDEWKAAFKTSNGLFEPTVMFFSLTNSPATFQTMVDDELMEFIDLGEGSMYMDDIVIHTDGTEEEHEAVIHTWLEKLSKLNLFLKPSKCQFYQCEVEYLGMIVGNGAVRMDPVKVKGITEWLTPACVKDVRSFLGFCNFYRAFISDFSNIARLLNDLTCKNHQWDWSAECEQAFQHLKEVCVSEPVLKTPDWTKPFVMHTDCHNSSPPLRLVPSIFPFVSPRPNIGNGRSGTGLTLFDSLQLVMTPYTLFPLFLSRSDSLDTYDSFRLLPRPYSNL